MLPVPIFRRVSGRAVVVEPKFRVVSVALSTGPGSAPCPEARLVARTSAFWALISPWPNRSSLPVVPRSSLSSPACRAESNCAGVRLGCTAFISAATPATWGAAMEVPLRMSQPNSTGPELPSFPIVLITPSPRPSPLISVAVLPPGAAISMVAPVLEYPANELVMVVALTDTTPL